MNNIFSLHEKRNKKQFFPKLNFIEQFVWQRCRGDTKLRQTRKIDIYFCWRCDEFVLLNYWEKIHCEALFIFNSIFDNFDWNWIIYREFVETFLSTFYRVAQEVAAQMSAAKSSPSREVCVCRGLVCLLATIWKSISTLTPPHPELEEGTSSRQRAHFILFWNQKWTIYAICNINCQPFYVAHRQ